jgi:SAM-dependent methyltransferase
MNYTGERVVPWNLGTGIVILNAHVRRYAWALPYVWGKKVVDLGCGTGYGTFMLSWAARQAIGLDIDVESIAFASRHFKAPNLEYGALDITKRCRNGDIYVAFEVLEHLDDPTVITEKYRPLVWSMPIEDGSRFHKRAYTYRDIEALMGDIPIWQMHEGSIIEPGAQHSAAAYALGVLE